MNASFRTAFWAMCLGLTVPMVLLVGVELTSGGRAARKSSLAAADSNASLRSQWANAGSKIARRDAAGARSPGKTGSPRQHASGNSPKPDALDAAVVLGPFLELDQATEPESGRDHRVPAVTAGNRPRVDIVPDEVADSAASRPDNREIEMRLASIQSHLDRLGHAIADQPQREPPADPVKQAADLLKQLQQARELDKVAAQFPKLAEPEPVEDTPELPATDQKPKPAESDAKPGTAPEPLPEPLKKPRLLTKIYRPRHLSGSSLSALVSPLLTPNVGRAGASDAGTGESAQAAGGDASGAPVSAVVVRDYPEVLRKIDRLVKELDVPPIPVMIEATVVTVRLDGGMPQGIDLAEFNSAGQSFVVTAADGVPLSMAGKGAPPLTGVGESPGGQATVLTHGFGLKCGILQGDPRAFLSALEGAVKTRRTSAWQLNALNRQSAQIILNEPFEPDGAVASAAAGTILNVRPIVRGGLVHLDIRREVDLGAAGSGSPSAALTHQIVLREGQTAVVGGFYAEYLAARSNAAAGVGEAPLAGRVSRRQSGVIERSETIVILTPHVVYSKSVEPGQSRRAHVPRATGGDRPIVQQTAGTLDPPRRLPAGSTATVRLMGAEAPGGDPTTDVETIPVLELPGENEPRPTIRPAGAK